MGRTSKTCLSGNCFLRIRHMIDTFTWFSCIKSTKLFKRKDPTNEIRPSHSITRRGPHGCQIKDFIIPPYSKDFAPTDLHPLRSLDNYSRSFTFKTGWELHETESATFCQHILFGEGMKESMTKNKWYNHPWSQEWKVWCSLFSKKISFPTGNAHVFLLSIIEYSWRKEDTVYIETHWSIHKWDPIDLTLENLWLVVK